MAEVVTFISLGDNCITASAIESQGYRVAAFPFDWCITPMHSILSCFTEDFARHLESPQAGHGSSSETMVKDAYGIEYRHDFPTEDMPNVTESDGIDRPERRLKHNWLDSLDDVKSKYTRRIQRMRDLCNNPVSRIVFVRHGGITQSDAEQFVEIVKEQYPNLKFKLLVVNAAIHPTRPEIVLGKVEHHKEYNCKEDWKRLFHDAIHGDW